MNAREFFDAVVAMRQAQKDYYANRRNPQAKELLTDALAKERAIDNEITRVQRIMSEGATTHDIGK